MTSSGAHSAVVYSRAETAGHAGRELGQEIAATLGGRRPDAVILFASSRYDAPKLLQSLHESCRPAIVVGCSTLGEFTNSMDGEGHACAIAISSSELKFACGIGRDMSHDRVAAATGITQNFYGGPETTHRYSAGLVLTDAHPGDADELIDQLTILTGGSHQLFGGGAGDEVNFGRTQVFHGLEAVSDAAVGLEILSTRPIGVGIRHGWRPAGKPMRVTEVSGMNLRSLNAVPVLEVFEEHAAATGQELDRGDPMPFFVENVLGIETGSGFKLRMPLAIKPDGSVACAAEIQEGAVVRLMSTAGTSPGDAVTEATAAALAQLEGHTPEVAMFFDCFGRRIRAPDYGTALLKAKQVLDGAPFAGCNVSGQVARTEAQFSGFHNCAAVVCILPS